MTIEVQNLPFFKTHLESLNVDFFRISPLSKAEIDQIEKIQIPKNGKKTRQF